MQAKDSGMGHFTLFLPRGIGAGAQGKPGVVVSQNNLFDIHVILQGCCSKGGPEVVEHEVL